MSRRRIMFIGMTTLSAIGFLVDRLFLHEPAPVAAAPVTRPRAGKKSTAPTQATPPGIADPSLPYLDRLDRGATGRDVFSMTPDMLLYYKALQEHQEEEIAKEGPLPGSPEEFKENHTLDGTFQGPGGPMAVISGEVLRPGDQIDEFRLVKVDTFGVELRRGRDRVVLELAGPGVAASGPKSKVKVNGKRPAAKPAR